MEDRSTEEIDVSIWSSIESYQSQFLDNLINTALSLPIAQSLSSQSSVMTTPETFTDTPNPSTGTSELLPLPKRGGKDLYLLGTYIGGFPFKIDYTTLSKTYSYYCSTFQVQSPKVRALAEKILYDAKLLDTSHDVNFNGSLELPRKQDSIAADKELVDKVDLEVVLVPQLESLMTLVLVGPLQHWDMVITSSCSLLAKVTEALLAGEIRARILTSITTRFLVGSPLALLSTVAIIVALERCFSIIVIRRRKCGDFVIRFKCNHLGVP